MKKLLAAAVVVTSLLGLGAATAKPGPNGHNNHGLCTAYFAGSDNGQAHKHKAPPFVALEQAADQAGDNNGQATPQEVMNYCAPFMSPPGGGDSGGGD